MRSYDIFPLFRRAAGYSPMAQFLNAAMQEAADPAASPAFDIKQKGEGAYQITLAVPGFSGPDLDVTQQENALIVTGKDPGADPEAEDGNYLHRGISGRAFESRFQLADHIRVESASLNNGLLSVALVRDVPEEKQPRRIAVNAAPALEQKAA